MGRMFHRLLPLVAVAVVLAPAGAATASSGLVHAGPPVSGNGLMPSPSMPTTTGPTLAVAGSKPIVVRGVRFAQGESVRVTFRTGAIALARTVRATPAGAFALTAPQMLVYDPCRTTLVIVARGSTGDLVTVKRPPRGCAPG
jgi:hypothetical protein